MNPFSEPVSQGDDLDTVWKKIAVAYGATPVPAWDNLDFVKMTICATLQGVPIP